MKVQQEQAATIHYILEDPPVHLPTCQPVHQPTKRVAHLGCRGHNGANSPPAHLPLHYTPVMPYSTSREQALQSKHVHIVILGGSKHVYFVILVDSFKQYICLIGRLDNSMRGATKGWKQPTCGRPNCVGGSHYGFIWVIRGQNELLHPGNKPWGPPRDGNNTAQ